jgi:hypothetical protein
MRLNLEKMVGELCSYSGRVYRLVALDYGGPGCFAVLQDERTNETRLADPAAIKFSDDAITYAA